MMAGKKREQTERLVEPVPLLGLSLGDVLLGLMETGRNRPEPAPAGQASALEGVTRATPFCADESCHTSEGPDAARRALRLREPQARQDRRADRGTAGRRQGGGAGLRADGRLHAG